MSVNGVPGCYFISTKISAARFSNSNLARFFVVMPQRLKFDPRLARLAQRATPRQAQDALERLLRLRPCWHRDDLRRYAPAAPSSPSDRAPSLGSARRADRSGWRADRCTDRAACPPCQCPDRRWHPDRAESLAAADQLAACARICVRATLALKKYSGASSRSITRPGMRCASGWRSRSLNSPLGRCPTLAMYGRLAR